MSNQCLDCLKKEKEIEKLEKLCTNLRRGQSALRSTIQRLKNQLAFWK